MGGGEGAFYWFGNDLEPIGEGVFLLVLKGTRLLSVGPDVEVALHSIVGYEERLSNLLHRPSRSFPAPTSGFSEGAACEASYAELCRSGSCFQNTCQEPFAQPCVKLSCVANKYIWVMGVVWVMGVMGVMGLRGWVRG